MNKCGIFIFLIVMLSKVSFAENYQRYNCVAKLHNGSDHSTIKFPLKILKYYGDGYVVFSRENILGEKILVFGRIRNDNELVGYLYDDKFIQYEVFTINDEKYMHFVFYIDKDQKFPYPNGRSIFYTKGLKSPKGTKQGDGISFKLSQTQFDLEKEIFLFNYDHLMTILENKKNNLFVGKFDHTCKN